MPNQKVFSPIGIDLGAKHTGVYLNQYTSGEMFLDGDQKHIVISDENNKIWLQKSRTAVRHARRGRQRRKLAKRFLLLILKDELKIEKELNIKVGNVTLEEKLCGLLNRRGFSFLSEDVEEIFEELDLSFLRESLSWLNNYETEKQFILKFLADLGNEKLSLDEVEASTSTLRNKINERGVPGKRGITYAKEDKEVNKHLKMVEGAIEKYKKSKFEGQRHRNEYLTNIKHDLEIIRKDYKLTLQSEMLWKLIGNISNLQERFLRKYFNNIDFKEKDLIIEDRMNLLLRRYISRWYPDKNNDQEYNSFKEATRYAELGWKQFFFELTPHSSIPPYENQNNRGTQECESLILDPEKLSKRYSGWRGLCKKIDNSEYREISNINENKVDWRFARKLQFFLDRSMKEGLNKKFDESLRVLSTPEDKQLKALLDDYYEESYKARYGFWDNEDSRNLMSVCSLKCKHKGNMKDEHLKAIVGEIDTDELLKLFEEKKTILFKKSSELIKEYGNRLNWELKKNIESITEDEEKKENLKLKKHDEKIKSFCQEISSTLANVKTSKFNNIYSFAQIYSILYEDNRSGFSKSCVYCTIDNENRMRETDDGAFATRLATSAARPIDGSIGRLLDDVAWKITQHKIEQLQKLVNIKQVLIPIFIEQNAFEFQESLIEIKKRDSGKGVANFGKSAKKAAQRLDNSYKNEGSKFERIQNDAQNVCAYSGVQIGDGGEFDHIIPASFSKNANKSILNSDVNLIYVSSQGNQKKGNRLKKLDDLDGNYLNLQFGTSSSSEVKKILIDRCKDILNKHGSLERLDIKYLRHGLFVDELRSDIIRAISYSTKAKVNGTQKYFAKILSEKLKKTSHIEVQTQIFMIRSDEVSIFRKTLGQQDETIKKNRERQGPSSHILDAFLTTLVGIKNMKNYTELMETIVEDKKIVPTCLKILNNFRIDRINSLPIQSKKNIESKALFKDTIFGESFAPLLYIGDNKWKMGFSIENSIDLGTSTRDWTYFDSFKEFLIYKGRSLDEIDLDREVKDKNYIYFNFNKRKVFGFLNESKNEGDSNKLKFIKEIEKFRYTWKRVNVAKYLLDDKGKLDSGIEEKVKKDNPIKGLTHPSESEWKACLDFTKKLLKSKDGSIAVGELNEELMRVFGKEQGENPYKHRGVRKTLSLPVKGSGNTRIRRFTPKRDEVYQLLSSEGNIGEYIVSGNENGSHDVLPFYKGINVLSTNNMGEGIHGKRFDSQKYYEISNLPQNLKENGVLKFEVCPKTSDRFYGKLRVQKNKFLEILEEPSMALEGITKIKKGKIFEIEELGDARDQKVHIEEVSTEFVTFTYQMSSTPKAVRVILNQTLMLI